MITAVSVVKYNGTRNAFALVDARVTPLAAPVAFARRVCDATSGIAADGLLLLLPVTQAAARSTQPATRSTQAAAPLTQAAARMRIINADGSEAEMCGNGVRCVARYLDECDGRSTSLIETLAGPITTQIVERHPAYRVAVELNAPQVGAAHEIAGFLAIPVDVGNPHVVIFVDDLAAIDLHRLGPLIERDARYPNGTNVHFARVTGPASLDVLHWERGAGATPACGTGAVACAAAAITTRGLTSPVELRVPVGC